MPDIPNVAQVEDLAREYIERRGTECLRALKKRTNGPMPCWPRA
jgi:hypothetical protein